MVSEAGGQVPLFAATTCGHALPAVALSRFAQQAGADGVMAMPPHMMHPDAAGCYEYYCALSSALDIPIMIQNYSGPVGTPMTPELIGRLRRELPHVEYVKEETVPSSRMVSLAIAAAGPHCKGVFGGQAGQYLLDEYRRGAVGNMPACQTTDLLQGVWDLLEAGDEQAARACFNRVLPLTNTSPLWWVLALGAGFGGDGTPIGATAIVVTVSQSVKTRTPSTLRIRRRSGLPVMLVTCVVATIPCAPFFGWMSTP